MMVDHYIQYEQNSLIHLRYITTYSINEIMGINDNMLIQSQHMLYMLQIDIMVDYCTKI